MVDQTLIAAKLDVIEQNRAKQTELLASLRCSLKIQSLWPDAFAHGKVKTGFEGDLTKPHTLRLVIKRSDGETRSFPFDEVPWILLEAHVNQFPSWFHIAHTNRLRLKKWRGQT